MEAKLQAEVIKWLRGTGAYVVKTKPGPGMPVGCPDILFFYGSRWGAIECKAGEKARYQPGQFETLERLRKGNRFVFVVFPEIWQPIKEQLQRDFFSSIL